MIKTIIFDNFGVLVSSNEETLFPAIEKKFGPKKAKIFRKIYLSNMDRNDVGEITSSEFFEMIKAEMGIKSKVQELEEYSYSSFCARDGMEKLVQGLQSEYRLVIISDAPDVYWEYAKNWPVINLFDRENIFLSFELKATKKDPETFKRVLRKLDAKPFETIFIDDDPANLKIATSVGIITLKFESPEKLKKDLESLLK